MKTITINSMRAPELAIDAIHQAPILVQLPTVFVLLAAPTSAGATQLDNLKTRLPGKNYGTAIGALTKFIGQADSAYLPREFSRPGHYKMLNGSFMRLPFRNEECESKTIRNGTHQGLLLPVGPYTELFKRIESTFEFYAPDPMWMGKNYCAPLCTSCNVSGDPEGSIVDYEKAQMFAEERGIGLFITATRSSTEKGSYPIFGFERDTVRIYRDGPGLAALKTRIPARLSTW